jgi:hypothetical protein
MKLGARSGSGATPVPKTGGPQGQGFDSSGLHNCQLEREPDGVRARLLTEAMPQGIWDRYLLVPLRAASPMAEAAALSPAKFGFESQAAHNKKVHSHT